MFKTPKQEHTAEFKDLAVKRVLSGQSLAAVAKALGLVEQTLRNWSKAAKAGKLHRRFRAFGTIRMGPKSSACSARSDLRARGRRAVFLEQTAPFEAKP